MRLVIVKRVKPLPMGGILIPVLSIVIGFIVSSLIIWGITGVPPSELFLYVYTAFYSPHILKTFLILTMLGIALLISFSGAIWNIGAEGQITLGMMATAYITLFTTLAEVDVVNKLVFILLAAVAGGLWATLAGVLRAYVNIDEVPVTLIFNYIAYYMLNFLVKGPWRGKQTYGYIRTDLMPENTWFIYVPGTVITYEAIVLTVIVVVGSTIFFKYTGLGLRIRVLGSNPDALLASGVNVKLLIVLALTLSGLIAGVAGAVQLAGDLHRISYPIEHHTANFGYIAILVAWLTMLDIRVVPIAAYVVSALYQAGYQLQIAGVGGAAIQYILIGSVLLTFTILRTFSEYSVKLILRRR